MTKNKNLLFGFLCGVLTLLGLATISAQTQLANEATTFSQVTLSRSEQALVDDSRKAIIETGISEEYFNAHFRLLKVIDKDSDRRVSWKFLVNGYDTVVTDSVGFLTEGTKRVYVHSVAKTLGKTSDIQETLSRVRANKIMKNCIGAFESPHVQYGPVAGRAQLFLVAQARTGGRESKSEREREREREHEELEKRKVATTGTDRIESEEDGDLPKVILGSVNLQTGQCTKGAGLIAP